MKLGSAASRSFVYVTEVDISIDDGPGINEREFVKALRAEHADEVICVLPFPSRPDVYYDPGIEYVYPVRRRAHRYPAYLISTFRRIHRLRCDRDIAAAAFRLGISPILPLAVHGILGIPVILKSLLLYSVFAEEENVRASRTSRAAAVSRVARLLRPAYRMLLQECVFADTSNAAYAEWLGERFGLERDRLIIVPNGFNPDVFTSGDPAAARASLGLDGFEHIIGYVGRFSEIRHVDELVRCVAALSRRLDVALVLVGDGPGRRKVEDLTDFLGVSSRVRLVGSVPYARVPEYLRSFDVALDLTMVTVPIRGVECHASFSQKIAQYLGSGVPVVAMDTPETRFLSRAGIGATVPLNDPRALEQAVEELLCMPRPAREQLRERARSYAETHLSARRVTAIRVEAWRKAVQPFAPVAANIREGITVRPEAPRKLSGTGNAPHSRSHSAPPEPIRT